jgi:hypothetical protein
VHARREVPKAQRAQEVRGLRVQHLAPQHAGYEALHGKRELMSSGLARWQWQEIRAGKKLVLVYFTKMNLTIYTKKSGRWAPKVPQRAAMAAPHRCTSEPQL